MISKSQSPVSSTDPALFSLDAKFLAPDGLHLDMDSVFLFSFVPGATLLIESPQISTTARVSGPTLLPITRRGQPIAIGTFRVSIPFRCPRRSRPVSPRLSLVHLEPASRRSQTRSLALDSHPSHPLPSSPPLLRRRGALSKRRGQRSSQTAPPHHLLYVMRSSTSSTRPSGRPNRKSTATC